MITAQISGSFKGPSTQLSKTYFMLGTMLSITLLPILIKIEGDRSAWHYTKFFTWIISIIPLNNFMKDAS